MKKNCFLLIPLSLVLIAIECKKDEPEHDIVNIPDGNFLSALINHGVDTNGDGLISHDEAKAITELSVTTWGIEDVTGIEAFVNLKILKCDGLPYIPMGSNPQGLLTSLDVSKNTALSYLLCTNNKLTSLDISNNLGLTELWCDLNGLSTLDASNNTLLTFLNCNDNQITSLDVSNCTSLIELWCDGNELTSLDVSNNTALTEILCNDNELTVLNVSNNTALTKLVCYNNQLTILDIFMNRSLQLLNIADNPVLTKVCVWTMPFPPEGVKVYRDGSFNVYFTTDCNK